MRTRVSLLLAAGAAALALAFFVVLVSPQVRAGPPPPVTVHPAASLADSDRAVSLSVRSLGGERLVEPNSASGRATLQPLAASPDGRTVALSTVPYGQVGPLTLVRDDGSQLEVELPGLRAAAFEPGGAWLVAVALAGDLWRADALSGSALRLADGPFGPDPTVLPDGRIVAIRLSSVDAPIWAAAELVDATTGATAPVGTATAADQLVYGASALDDGSLAIVRHQVGGGVAVVQVRPDGREALLTSQPRAASVAVSPDGQWIAWPEAGVTWLASAGDGSAPIDIGDGAAARFSPNGSLLLVFSGSTTSVVDTAGGQVAQAGPTACWLGDGRGCRP